MSAELEPRWPLRHAQLQSALASFKPRNWSRRRHPMNIGAQARILDCGNGVRLQGYHSPQPKSEKPKGLAVLIHGWEGGHTSVYLTSLACTLYDAGFNVFRLNLRDHGGTHHLNEDIFHSARLDEVIGAVRAIQTLDATSPMSIIGFSLGGNFALRLGLRGPAAGLHPAMAVGVSPAIDPGATLDALDRGPRLFHRYFMDKWHKTMRAKSAAWPGRYDFSEVMERTCFRDITAWFVERHTEFERLEDYLAAYTIDKEALQASPTPLGIIAAQDDPVVPIADFSGLESTSTVKLLTPRYGGHCGFIENLKLRSWAEHRILELLPTAKPD